MPLSDELASFLLLGGAAVAGYAAVRGAVDALIASDDPAPARRAMLHSTMTAIVSFAAIFHHPALLDIAVGAPFAAVMAALTLALGVVLFVAMPRDPSHRHSAARPQIHRVWAFILPTGLLTLLIGFSGELSPTSAVILASEGVAVLIVGMGSRKREPITQALTDVNSIESYKRPPGHRGLVVLQLILSVLLAVAAGWGMVQGAAGLKLHDPAFRPGVAAVLALGPAIVLPMIPPLATLAEHGRRDDATTAIVGFSLINLCAVLPLIVFAWRLLQIAAPTTQPSEAIALPFPLLVWRLDTVLLCTVGLLLLPTAIGRWTLSRLEGAGLVGVYVLYLFLTLIISHG
jgi:Ca2+/Na+ antiporter